MADKEKERGRQKYRNWISQERKELFRWNKFWRAIIWWKLKIWWKIAHTQALKLHCGEISQNCCILRWAFTAGQCLFWSECERKQCLFEGDACLRPAITCNKITLSNINFEIFLLFKANALKILLDVMPLKSIKY